MSTDFSRLDSHERDNKKRVVIVGGGFAGLAAARSLSSEKRVQVILLDQKNHHLFQPLLYQVATAGLNPSDIAVPIRSQFDDAPNVEVHLAKVQSVDLESKKVFFAETRSFDFDYLVLGCGATHSYFGKPEWEEHAPGLKTIEQATEIRRRILTAFENAENELDETKQREFLTFVVVGGGPTGVEMAGAISDISQSVLTDDFKRFSTRNTRVILIEAGNRILSSFDERLSAQALRNLQSMGVEVRLGGRVTEISADGVQIGGTEFIPAKTVIWAAGVQAAKLSLSPPVERDRSGRVFVESDFSLKSYPQTFVVGDMAAFKLENSQYLPGLAPVAKQGGEHIAKMIRKDLDGKPRQSFRYVDKGQMATIGKRKAIAQIGQFRISGIIAWFGWLFIHVLYLVGFKNKFSVLLQWAWSYLFEKRGSRLITGKEWKLERDSNPS